jgi:cellobiose transport system permease protein
MTTWNVGPRLAKSQPSGARYGLLARIWKAKTAYGFIAPFYLLFAVFGVFPVIYSFYLAFFQWSGFGPKVFVGLQNFRTLFGDTEFITSVENTLILWLGHIFLLLAISLALAMLVNVAQLRFKAFYRVVIFAPNMAAVVAMAMVFSLVFTTKLGLLDQLLGHLGVDINWLGSSAWSKPSIMLLNSWDMAGFYMLVFLAGLQTIDASLYEAAKVDGAGPLRRFRHVTLPGLKRIIFFAFILESIGSMQIFVEPSVLTNGGPGTSSTSVALYLYNTAFEYLKLGYAAAMSIALFVLTVAVTLIVGWFWRGQLFESD